MTATVREVAKRAGVSAMTVSRVINGRAGVRPATRSRVEQAIADLDFLPNRVARGLTSSKTGAIGLIVPDLVNPFFTVVLRGAEMVARRAGYRVLLCNTESDLALERSYIEDMVSHRVEGLIIAPVNDSSRLNLSPLIRRRLPFVLIDRAVPGIDSDLVQADSAAGARRLMQHLVAIGHRRIALIIGSDDVSTTRERARGYRQGLGDADIPFDADLVVKATVDRIGGYRAMQQILRLERRPTAVFAVNNMTAMGAMQAIREAGLSVPQHVALVCFDDVEHLAVLSPFMTVIDQPAETFGTLAVQMLLERVSGDADERPRLVVLQTRLIVRQSCGKLWRRLGPPETPGSLPSQVD
jgi:LacI family transcriptional regulator